MDYKGNRYLLLVESGKTQIYFLKFDRLDEFGFDATIYEATSWDGETYEIGNMDKIGSVYAKEKGDNVHLWLGNDKNYAISGAGEKEFSEYIEMLKCIKKICAEFYKDGFKWKVVEIPKDQHGFLEYLKVE